MAGQRPRAVVVGVAGGSGAGKSSVVRRLVQGLGAGEVAVVRHDAYYRDLSHLTPAERERVNYDHPDAIETDLLVRHVGALLEGSGVDVPDYDFTEHVRRPAPVRVEWRPVVIVDGLFVLSDQRLRPLLDLRVFVDTPETVRLERRLRRDVLERGRSPASVEAQYRATVRPMHLEFVEPSKVHADVIIADGGDNRAGIDLAVARIRALVASVWGD
jgi:uridine kinase